MITSNFNVLIASYLEPELVERIRQVDQRLNVIYEPELLAVPEYPADHYGVANRTPEQEQRWLNLLREAEILFDFDHTHRQELPDLAPKLLWIQATSAGIGQFVNRYGYGTRLPHTILTTASGVHARPMAEFCIMAMLGHYKGLLSMVRNQQRKHWERSAGTELLGRTLAVIGLGNIGREVANMACSLGMTVIGSYTMTNSACVEHYYSRDQLHAMLPDADVVVMCVPHTPQTEKMIGKSEFDLMKAGAYFINIARGAVVDEPALIHALESGHLGGAALDVFQNEPLPTSSPLWEMENVLISPHSAGTSSRENERLTDLFCDNLRRFLDGHSLRNVLDPELFY